MVIIVVLEVYRITLLSNCRKRLLIHSWVLEVYRITLLSNTLHKHMYIIISFRSLQNYTTLKHNYVAFQSYESFRSLQNYTTLKQHIQHSFFGFCFRSLQNYTTLKLASIL